MWGLHWREIPHSCSPGVSILFPVATGNSVMDSQVDEGEGYFQLTWSVHVKWIDPGEGDLQLLQGRLESGGWGEGICVMRSGGGEF
jgi:hypothetical protein